MFSLGIIWGIIIIFIALSNIGESIFLIFTRSYLEMIPRAEQNTPTYTIIVIETNNT